MSQQHLAVGFPAPTPVVDHLGDLLGGTGTPVTGPDWVVHRFVGEFSSVQIARARELTSDAGGTSLVLPEELVAAGPGLLVSDVDSTLITAEVIELIAERAGTRARVAEITERAMRGELDFAASLTERVATLAGVPESVFAEVTEQVRYSPGAEELAGHLRAAGWTFGLVSGGFTEIVAPLAQRLGIDHFVANRLEVRDGHLTGRVSGDIVTGQTKADTLRHWAAELDVPLTRTVAVGDGANDLAMMDVAAVGFAYCAKPIVAQQATASITFPRLDVIAALLGL